LLVAAAAGGGKTTVLVERFVHLVMSGKADPENLPTLTFTEKAADQLKRRVRQRLVEKNVPKTILRGLDGAYISTIHSFCKRLLKENYHLADIDPSFLVIPGEESRLLKRQALDEMFEDIFEGVSIDDESGAAVRDLCNAHGGYGFEEGIKGQVLKLYHWLMRQTDPAGMLSRIVEESNADPLTLPGFISYMELLQTHSANLQAAYERLMDWANDTKKDGTKTAYAKNIEQAYEAVQEAVGIDPEIDIGKFIDALRSIKHPAMRGKPPPELKSESDRIKSTIFKRMNDLVASPFDEGIEEMTRSHQRLGVLAELTRIFIERYERLKERRWGLDFDDLQHRLMRVLRNNPNVGERYRERFRHLLIDEFQDDNYLQEAIIREVCSPEGMFMVGDIKQAIYRFRGAEPRVYMENEARLADDEEGGLINLDLNFRSLPSICNAVNGLMHMLFTACPASIDYAQGHVLKASRESAHDGDPPVEFNIISCPRSTSGFLPDEDDPDDRRVLEIEADWLAARIRSLVEDEKTTVPSGNDERRPAGYGDTVVLLRSMKGRAAVFAEALKRRGIPHRVAGTGGFLEGQEIRDIRNLLRIIDNPLQDIPFAAILRSPICGIDAGDLYALRNSASDDATLYEGSLALLESDPADFGALGKLAKFMRKFDRWRSVEPRLTPAELILDIYQHTSYPEYVLGLDGGRIMRANLERFVDAARDAVPVGEGGLRRFLNYLDDLEAGEMSIEPGEPPEDEGVVTIMTIHAAKGLEFPVVFVPDLGKKFNFDDLRGEIIMDDDHGPAYKYVDTDAGYSRPTYDYLAFKERIRGHSMSEELRILYVAFTRAREKLVISGAIDPGKLNGIAEEAGGGFDTYASTPMDWLLPVPAGMDGFDGFTSSEPDTVRGSVDLVGSYNAKLRVILTPAAEIERSRKQVVVDDVQRKLIAEFHPIEIKFLKAPPGIHAVLTEYPYTWAANIEDKITAGRIESAMPDARDGESFELAPVRWDIEYEGVSDDARQAGIALHAAFELIDFLGIGQKGWAVREAGRIAGLIDMPQGWDAKRLAESFEGLISPPLLDVLQPAGSIWVERAFSLKLPVAELSTEIMPKPQAKDWIMLQGRMDLVAVSGKTAWLIDYKSDAVPGKDFSLHSQRYIPQLAAYAEALKRIGGFDVKAVIYYLRHGTAFDITEDVSRFDLGAGILEACRIQKT